MKLNKMKWLGTIMGVLLLFIASCESDNHSKDIDAEKPFKEVLKIGDFKKEFLKKNINSKEFLYNLIVDNTTQSNSKSNPLSVELSNSDVVKLISKDNLITYTVNVKTNDTDSRSHFYKLVIITQGNKHDTKLLKFLPNVIEDNTANSSFKGTILNISLEGNSLSAKSCGLTFTVEVFVPCIIHGELSPNDGCWGGHWETQVVDGCGGGGATTWTDNSGNIGGGGDGSYTYNGVYPIYTYSSAEVKQMFDNFVLNELNSEQQGFLTNNPTTIDAIKEYLSANVNYPDGFKSEAKEFAKQLLNFAMVNNITFTFNNLDPKNFKSFNNFQELQSFLDSENIDLQDNTETNDVTDIGPDKKISRRKIGLTPTHDLAVELVFTPMPNFELDNSQSTVELSSMITIPGYDWKQKAMIVSNSNWSSTEAEITITGYILYGIKVGDFELGIPKHKEIKLAMDKKNGKICCTSVKNIE
jgi:hypothetical protein